MLSSKSVIALLFASVAVAEINSDYHHVLSGKETLTDAHVDQMYSQFVNQYKDASGHTPSHVLSSGDRKKVFAQTVKEVIQHNTDPSQTYQMGINGFSDMTHDEFAQAYHLVNDPQHCSATTHLKSASNEAKKNYHLQDIPSHWDWRDVGGVTPVKNQRSCGSCWTFSTVGTLESHYMLKYGQFRNLSEQQLVDCASAYDNHGCNGGLPSHAFQYINDVGGLVTEDDYPYKAVTQNCTVDPSKVSVGIKGGSVNVTQGDEGELLRAVFQNGPVSIAYQVAGDFKSYKTGVYSSKLCNSTAEDVNHAVVAVGFGHQDGMDYWIVKNSWGTTWGDNGFFKIQRGVNMCGISNCNSYPYDVYDATKKQIPKIDLVQQ